MQMAAEAGNDGRDNDDGEAAPSRRELDHKYKDLIKKINRQTNQQQVDEDEAAANNESADGLDVPVQDGGGSSDHLNPANRLSYNDNKLKRLYDASVAFKNDLANLRGSIKNLNSKSQAYSIKCSDFQCELDSLFEMNKHVQSAA